MAAESDSESSSSSSSSSDDEQSVSERGNNVEKSSSSSSSSSSSDEEESVDKQVMNKEQSPVTDDETAAETADAATADDHEDYGNGNDDNADNCKIFLSRIPQAFDEECIKRILEGKFGDESVVEVSIAQEKSEEEFDKYSDKKDFGKESKSGKDDKKEHRGFGFVTFATEAQCQAAIEAGTVRGSTKPSSKRKHTLYIRPVVRDDENNEGCENVNKNVCFLWRKFRCPYGDGCKFVHEGDGGCVADGKNEDGTPKEKKKQKCFAFKKTGKCKLGDKCPYSHDVVINDSSKDDGICKKVVKDKSQKDCINWKNKGKCRKGDKCPFRHDEAVRDKVLQKKRGKDETNSKGKKDENKVRQSLSIRVFGLNYDTLEVDIRKFFAHCGPIVEVTFPTFEDSGRSKGYCGVLFQSPKATQKAIELDGKELHGRWLSIQEGKMYLRKWEEVEKTRDDARKQKWEDEKEEPLVGEYGQKVKRRKKHGFKD